MDAKLSHRLKYKVNQVFPAIFTDNMTKVIMEGYNIPWKINFTTKDSFVKFRTFYGSDILFDISVLVCPIYQTDDCNPCLWHGNEYNFSRLLHVFRKDFSKDIAEATEDSFMLHCSMMLYYSVMYFKKGLLIAPKMAFLEVYSLTCVYLQQNVFTPELRSALCG